MNNSQRFGLFILVAITVAYIYFSFFNNNGQRPVVDEQQVYNPLEQSSVKQDDIKVDDKTKTKIVKIFLLDKSGNLRSVSRTCDAEVVKSCTEYVFKELVNAPTKWEKSKGFTSEIPQGTKVISVRESANSIMVDLSSNFEAGGGAESTYMRIKQVIKTANANSTIPTYLYINGRQANVIGGEGIMIKQPLNERSFDE